MQTVILDATTKTLKGVLASAITTTQPDYVIAWADSTSTTFTEGSSNGAFNSTSDVTMVAAPAASTRRVIKSITVYNRDTASITFTLKFDDNGTQRFLTKQTLASGASWSSDDSTGGGGISGLTVGTTSVANGTSGNVLYNNAGTLGEYSSVPVSEGGTGATSASGARSNLLPSYTSNGGKVLAVNTGATDVEWITASGGGGASASQYNRLLNGDFVLDQRNDGTSAAIANDVYCLDRWYVLSQTASVNVSQQTNQENGSPTNIRITQNQATGQRCGIAQIIESINCRDLRNQSVALNFRVRCSTSQAIRYSILEWTGTADAVTSDVVNSWTSTTFTTGNFFKSTSFTLVATGSITPTANTWTTLTSALTGTVSSSMNNLIVFLWSEGTLAQNVTLDFSQVQLEQGSTSTAFQRVPLEVTIARCRRYYYLFARHTTGTNTSLFGGYYANTTQVEQVFVFPVTMRVAPTGASTSGTNYYAFFGAAGSDDMNEIFFTQATPINILAYNNTEVSGTAGQGGRFFIKSATPSGPTVRFDAEL